MSNGEGEVEGVTQWGLLKQSKQKKSKSQNSMMNLKLI